MDHLCFPATKPDLNSVENIFWAAFDAGPTGRPNVPLSGIDERHREAYEKIEMLANGQQGPAGLAHHVAGAKHVATFLYDREYRALVAFIISRDPADADEPLEIHTLVSRQARPRQDGQPSASLDCDLILLHAFLVQHKDRPGHIWAGLYETSMNNRHGITCQHLIVPFRRMGFGFAGLRPEHSAFNLVGVQVSREAGDPIPAVRTLPTRAALENLYRATAS
jgi:hypothetical protein